MISTEEKILNRIHETILLLNSNISDINHDARELTKTQIETYRELNEFYEDTEKNFQETKEKIAIKLTKIDKDFKNELFETSNNSLNELKKINSELKSSNIGLYEKQERTLKKLQERQEQIMQLILSSVNENVNENNQAVTVLIKRMKNELVVSQKKQDAALNDIQNNQRTLLKQLDQEVKSLKKNQRIGLAVLFITIFLGYFI